MFIHQKLLKRSCTENFMNILFYSWRKQLNLFVKRKLLLIVILSYRSYLSRPYISGRKSDHYVIEDFTTATTAIEDITMVISLCVVVISCRLIKWFCVLSHQWINKDCLQTKKLEGRYSGVLLKGLYECWKYWCQRPLRLECRRLNAFWVPLPCIFTGMLFAVNFWLIASYLISHAKLKCSRRREIKSCWNIIVQKTLRTLFNLLCCFIAALAKECADVATLTYVTWQIRSCLLCKLFSPLVTVIIYNFVSISSGFRQLKWILWLFNW